MEIWMPMSLQALQSPQPLTFLLKLVTQQTSLFPGFPTVKLFWDRGISTRWGGREEEEGPDPITRESPPSQRTWTNSLCLQTVLRSQQKLKLRVIVANRCKETQNYVPQRRTGVSRQWNKRRRCPRVSRVWKQSSQKMLQTLQAVEAIVDGEEATTDLPHTPGLLDLHGTTGTIAAPGAEEEPITCAAEEAVPVVVTAGASSRRWWRREERRCYDKGRQEGQWTNLHVPPLSVCIDQSPAAEKTFTVVSHPPVHRHHPALWYALSRTLSGPDGCCFMLWHYIN